MKRLVALALVACSSSPARAPEPPRPVSEPAGEPPRELGTAPIPTVHTPRDIAEAPHGGMIQTLAVSPDG